MKTERRVMGHYLQFQLQKVGLGFTSIAIAHRQLWDHRLWSHHVAQRPKQLRLISISCKILLFSTSTINVIKVFCRCETLVYSRGKWWLCKNHPTPFTNYLSSVYCSSSILQIKMSRALWGLPATNPTPWPFLVFFSVEKLQSKNKFREFSGSPWVWTPCFWPGLNSE